MLKSEMVNPSSNLTRAGSLLVALSPWEMETFFPAEQADRLKSLFPTAEFVDPFRMTIPQWQNLLESTRPEVLVSCWRTPRLPAHCRHLKYLCHLTGSVRGILPRELVVDGLKVTNWGTFAAPYVAEHALLLMLAALRSMPLWGDALNTASHPEHSASLHTRSLIRRRVSIHGFGQIARELIKLLKPFHVEIACFSAGVPRQLIVDHGVRAVDSLEALAEFAEVLVSCEALTDQSRGSIGRQVLSRLEVGAVFVNVGRGAIVNEPELAEIARQRNLRVASDVFAIEPLPVDSPMRSIPGAIYSPHIAGPTLNVYRLCGAMAIENLEKYIAGQPLEREVSLEIFDRST